MGKITEKVLIVHCPDYPVIINFLLWTHWPINPPQTPPKPRHFDIHGRKTGIFLSLFSYYLITLVKYEFECLFINRKSCKSYENTGKNLCTLSHFPKLPSWPDWTLHLADSGPWAICLTPLLYMDAFRWPGREKTGSEKTLLLKVCKILGIG